MAEKFSSIHKRNRNIESKDKTYTKVYQEKNRKKIDFHKSIESSILDQKKVNQKELLSSLIQNNHSLPRNQIKTKLMSEISSIIQDIIRRYYYIKKDNSFNQSSNSVLEKKTINNVTPSPPKKNLHKSFIHVISPPKMKNYENLSFVHKKIEFSILDNQNSYTPSNIE